MSPEHLQLNYAVVVFQFSFFFFSFYGVHIVNLWQYNILTNWTRLNLCSLRSASLARPSSDTGNWTPVMWLCLLSTLMSVRIWETKCKSSLHHRKKTTQEPRDDRTDVRVRKQYFFSGYFPIWRINSIKRKNISSVLDIQL